MQRLVIRTLVLATAGLLALVALPLAPTAIGAPAGDAARGRAFWGQQFCQRCHGANAQGAFGPDLAGRGLGFEQALRAIRQPWGIMPAYTEEQVSEQTVADLVAFFNGLPAPAEPGPWGVPSPTGAPLGQRLFIETGGCGQCHGATADRMRQDLGAEGVTDFDTFADLVYRHTDHFPKGRMGDFSRARMPEATLRTIWSWLSVDLGQRLALKAEVTAAGVGERVTYTLTIENPNRMAAGNLYVTLEVPEDARVASATQAGYQGVQGFAGENMAVWLAPRIGPGETATYQLTVTGMGAGGGTHAFVRWLAPTRGGEQIITPRIMP